MNRRTLAILTFCALAGCGGHDAGTQQAKPAVALATASFGTFVEQVTAVGRVGASAGSQTKLSFAEPGILRSVDVRIGERVSQGQALAELDTSGLSLAASQAQADAQAAQANAQQSAVDRTTTKIAVDTAALRREQSLYAAGVAALKDVQAARAQLAQDRAQAASARAQVSGASAQAQSAQDRAALAQRDLANGTLRAPDDGVVTGIYKRPGEAVDTTSAVIAIGPAQTNDVTLDVSASDAARVRAGDRVRFSIPGTALGSEGAVAGVSTALDPATQAATVIVRGLPSGAPAGSAVQATIDVARDRGIVIPQSAIVQDPQSGRTLVFVRTADKDGDAKFAQRPVTVERQNGSKALIASGLRPGERIAAQGGFALLAPAGGQ
ncbi:MAG TPA: efflux RND transporter periplasmic adaptor subunit [Candidatus Baltobacteraceae bacterium]|nr:efflux RND transporter periplasmic adaptor subunit [Candidatus Baltobacteraceae bacterium]